MPTRLVKNKGFSLIEVLVAMVMILLLGIALAKGVLEIMRLHLRSKLKQTAVQVVETWASYMESLPYNSWILNPDPNEQPGGADHYCYDCAFNRGYCDKEKRNWQTNQVCNNSNDPNCYYCSFMDPNYTPPFANIARPYDADNDNIVAIIDPYYGNNDCKDGATSCGESDMKYNSPTAHLAGWMRFLPYWGQGQGSSDCACRLGNCRHTVEGPWYSYDNSPNYRVDANQIGGLKCTYELGKGTSGPDSDLRRAGAADRVFVGMGIINYYYYKNPVKEAGKAIGIVAWYFDPIDKRYRAVNKIVFKERP